MRTPLISALLALAAAGSFAKDLGVQGTVYPIVERDIRQMMVEQAAQVEWDKVQEEVQAGAKAYLDNLPKRALPPAAQTQTVWMDPSIVLTSDIQVPVKGPDGTFKWQVLAAKGTRVNPLEQNRPVTAMLFFDGSDPDQLAAVAKVLEAEPMRITPVEAGKGSVRESHEKLARPVFHANDAMVSRFQLRHLPSLVYPGSGARSLYLGITSFAAPYLPSEILAAWPDIAPRSITSGTR